MKKQTSAGVTGTVVVPQVRYHPSIKTRTGDGLAGEAGSRCAPPQTEPEQKKVRQKPAAGPGPPGRRAPRPLKLVEGAVAAPGRAPSPAPQRRPPRLDPLPVVLGEQLDEDLVREVELRTRGQRTNEEWFAWRRKRITASLAPSIARCRFANGRSGTLPASYLAAIKGRPRPLHIWAQASWVIVSEAKARQQQQLGLASAPSAGWLRKSPSSWKRLLTCDEPSHRPGVSLVSVHISR